MKVEPIQRRVDPLYDSYCDLKGWRSVAATDEVEIFENILKATGLAQIRSVVEIGFGSGAFLDWARSRGIDILGVEILPEMIAAVEARGHRASLPYPTCLDIDAIVALDVLEHLSRDELADLFRFAARSLSREGVILARFPNAQSPFFGANQYGDLTHKCPLAPAALDQLARPHGFQVVRALNSRPLPKGTRRRLKRRLGYLLRDLFEMTFGRAYLGHRMPLDPNILVVLARA